MRASTVTRRVIGRSNGPIDSVSGSVDLRARLVWVIAIAGHESPRRIRKERNQSLCRPMALWFQHCFPSCIIDQDSYPLTDSHSCVLYAHPLRSVNQVQFSQHCRLLYAHPLRSTINQQGPLVFQIVICYSASPDELTDSDIGIYYINIEEKIAKVCYLVLTSCLITAWWSDFISLG